MFIIFMPYKAFLILVLNDVDTFFFFFCSYEKSHFMQ